MRAILISSSFLLKLKCSLVSLSLVVASIHPAALYAQGNDVDIVVPKISEVEPGRGVVGQPLSVAVTITDNTAVDYATLFYRFGESGDFVAQPMKQTQNDRYEATASPNNKTAKLFQYYIEAADTSGNITYRGFTFSPKTLLLTATAESQSSSELQSNSVGAATATDGAAATPAVESNRAVVAKSGNRTLYTVLGVLAAVVVVGVAANNLSDDGGQECEASGCLVTFTGTAP